MPARKYWGCKIEGCDNKHDAHGYCAKHGTRMKRNGTIELVRIFGDDEKRFHSKYIPVPETGCWLWTGECNRQGYGQIKKHGKTCFAHRVSWELHNGPIPDGMQVLHKCDVRCCVNPDHLYVGTQKDNIQDCVDRGRMHDQKGAKNSNAKLNWGDVMEIRELWKQGHTHKAVGEMFNVSKSHVYNICNNYVWTLEREV